MKKLKALLAILASGVLMTLSFPGTSATAVPQTPTLAEASGNFQNYDSERCILAGNGRETALVQATCAGYNDQRWVVHQDQYGLTYSNMNSGQCLLSRDWQEARQIPCGEAMNDAHWTFFAFDTYDPQWGILINQATGNCLVPQGRHLGALFVQNTCNYNNPPANQRWRFTNL
ncbi:MULTISPECIES: hypothetical protein [Streptomycetaceae]|uniref:hypothetical protein n=1 Tax=Streptomycetaceae TaxID=2062 RepID=UPI001160F937|nr:hypothetical protein [Streptomyces sp. CB02056]